MTYSDINTTPSMATISSDARVASRYAAERAFSPSPLNPFSVADAVGKEAAHRALESVARAEREAEANSPAQRTPALLGCWVDGKLRFQSRNHDNVHDYAQDAMRGWKHRSVWVAPVGSFVDAENATADDGRKMRRMKKG